MDCQAGNEENERNGDDLMEKDVYTLAMEEEESQNVGTGAPQDGYINIGGGASDKPDQELVDPADPRQYDPKGREQKQR